MKRRFLCAFNILIVLACGLSAFAQGTAFTYQGRLNDGGAPAQGAYDFEFAIYEKEDSEGAIGRPIRIREVLVEDGLFTVTLDFREPIFDGSERWLEIAVGIGEELRLLKPRQKLTPAPYAMTAGRALSAGTVTGVVPSGSLGGTYVNAVNFSNPGNIFAGDGANLSNLSLTAVGPAGTFDYSMGIEVQSSVQQQSHGTGLYAVAAGDLNGDGSIDLVAGNGGSGTITILTNSGGGFLLASTIVSGGKYGLVKLFDVSRDGRPDVLFAGGNTIGIAQNLGNGSFGIPSYHDAAPVLANFAAGDLNGDGWPDIATAARNTNVVSIFMNNGAGAFPANPTRYVTTTTNNPMTLALADVNGDSRTDLITAHGNLGGGERLVGIYPGDGLGGFGVPTTLATGDGLKTLLVEDVNRDGRPDIIVGMGQSGARLDIFRNLGGGNFTLHQTLPTTYIGWLTAGDFNGDGWLDIAATDGGFFGYTGMRMMINDRTGSLEQKMHLSPFNYTWATAADVDGDGQSELIEPANGGDTMRIYWFRSRLDPGVVMRTRMAFHGEVHMAPGSTITGNLNFGTQTRQMLNLWDKNYGIGVQPNTMFFRSDSQFAWYRGGLYSDFGGSGFGGSELMRLSNTELRVNGTFVSASDRDVKGGFEPVDPKAVLEKVATLPITRWHYTNDTSAAHLGPVAQDFRAAFGLGSGDKHIATVDADGVALAAIQGLNEKLEEQRAELKEKDAQIQELKKRMSKLEELLQRE